MEHGRLSTTGYSTAYYISIAERSVFVVVPLEIFRIPVQDNAKITFANMYTFPACISSVCISHTGNVYPFEGWQSYSLGNIKDAPMKQIWEESVGIKELRSLSYDDFPKCRVCKDKAFYSICLIRNANESKSGDFKQVNPYYCEIARMKKKLSLKIG